MSSQYGELRRTNGRDLLASSGHPCKSQRISRLGSVTARHSSSGRQPNFAVLNRGRHLYSTGRPSRWALAHILVKINYPENLASNSFFSWKFVNHLSSHVNALIISVMNDVAKNDVKIAKFEKCEFFSSVDSTSGSTQIKPRLSKYLRKVYMVHIFMRNPVYGSTIKVNWVIRQDNVRPRVRGHNLFAHARNHVGLSYERNQKSVTAVILSDVKFILRLQILTFGCIYDSFNHICTARVQKQLFRSFW